MKHKHGDNMFWIRATNDANGVFAFKEKTRKKADKSFYELAAKGYCIEMYNDTRGFHSTTQLEFLIMWHSNRESYWKNRAASTNDWEREKINNKRYIS